MLDCGLSAMSRRTDRHALVAPHTQRWLDEGALIQPANRCADPQMIDHCCLCKKKRRERQARCLREGVSASSAPSQGAPARERTAQDVGTANRRQT